MSKLTKTSVPVAWMRATLVQQLLKKSKCQSILCIPGVDSFYDSASLNFMDFVFPNFKVIDSKLKNKHEEDDEDAMEDVLICMEESGILIYCNPFNYLKLLNESTGLNRFSIFCLDEEKYSNADHAEEYKIRCLTYFTSNAQKIAIPFSSDAISAKVSPIERWPLIQAYAIEDYGKHGFFTLRHDVTNYANIIRQLSTELLDVHALSCNVLPKGLLSFSIQWTNFTAALNTVTDSIELLDKVNLAETFESYVKHGYAAAAKSSNTDEAINLSRCALVLPADNFSATICSRLTESSSSPTASEKLSTDFRSCFERSEPIVAFLKSSVPPYFATGRTFFVQTKSDDIRQQETERNLYKCLAEAAEYAVGEYVALPNPHGDGHIQKSEKIFLKAFHTKVAQFVDSKIANSIEHIFSIEDFPRSQELSEIQFPRAKFVIAALFVPDLSNRKGKIGLLFADTFLPVRVAACDSGIYSAQPFWLTNGIPRYVNVRNLELQRLATNANFNNSKQAGSVTLFGSQMAMSAFLPKHAALFPDAIAVTSLTVSLSTMDMALELANGLSVKLDGLLDIVTIQCYEQSSPPADFEAMFIEIKFSIRNRNNAAFPFAFNENSEATKSSSDGDVFVVCLQAKTLPYREFYRLILPSWSVNKDLTSNGSVQTDGTLITSAEKVSHLSASTRHIQRFSSIVGAHLKNGTNNMASSLPGLFLNTNLTAVQLAETQLVASSKFLPCKREVETALTGVWSGDVTAIAAADTNSNNAKVHVFVLCAMAESAADQLAKAIVSRKAGDDSNWLGTFSLLPSADSGAFAVNFRDEKLHVIDDEVLHRFRQFLADKLPSKTSSTFKGQAIILCPFFVSLPCVFAKLERNFSQLLDHNGTNFELIFKSAALCLDGYSDLALHNKSINSIAQDHLRPGLLSAVVAFSPPGRNRDTMKGQTFEAVRKAVRALNSYVVVYRSANDFEFEQLPNFWSKEMCALRGHFWTDTERLHYFHDDVKVPTNEPCCFTRSSQAVTLAFKQRVLQKDKLTANLYLLNRNINGPSLHHEQDPEVQGSALSKWCVWHVAGEIGFIDSEDVVRLTFTLPQQVFRIAPLHRQEPSSSFYLTFYGENLDEKVLRDWLRQSAHSRPVQQAPLRVEDLAPAFWGKLQTEHHLDPLPEGWFYNGTYYVDASGERAYKHPRLNEIVAEYVASFNAEIERKNSEARSNKFADLFD